MRVDRARGGFDHGFTFHGEHSLNLRIPGPTPCPEEVLLATAQQMINHRGPEFAQILRRVTDGLNWVFGTTSDVLSLTTSGRVSARDAEAVDTPAAFATSRSVSAVGGDRPRRRRLEAGLGSSGTYTLRNVDALALGAVRTENSRAHLTLVSQGRPELSASQYIPQSGCPVAASGQCRPPVGAEGCGPNEALMAERMRLGSA